MLQDMFNGIHKSHKMKCLQFNHILTVGSFFKFQNSPREERKTQIRLGKHLRKPCNTRVYKKHHTINWKKILLKYEYIFYIYVKYAVFTMIITKS